jgi:hypothetical protein
LVDLFYTINSGEPSELKPVNKETAPSGIPIEGLDEIELLLTSRNESSQNRFQEVENNTNSPKLCYISYCR